MAFGGPCELGPTHEGYKSSQLENKKVKSTKRDLATGDAVPHSCCRRMMLQSAASRAGQCDLHEAISRFPSWKSAHLFQHLIFRDDSTIS